MEIDHYLSHKQIIIPFHLIIFMKKKPTQIYDLARKWNQNTNMK